MLGIRLIIGIYELIFHSYLTQKQNHPEREINFFFLIRVKQIEINISFCSMCLAPSTKNFFIHFLS